MSLLSATANRLSRFKGPTLSSMVDQGLQSGTNFVATAVIASCYDKHVFAEFVLLIATTQITLALHRSYVILPFIMDQSHPLTKASASGWFVVSSLFAAVPAFLMAAAWFLTPAIPKLADFTSVFGYAVFLCPALSAYEFGRRCMYQQEKYRPATLAAAIAGLGYAIGIAVSATTRSGYGPAIIGYTIGSAIAAFVAGGVLKDRIRLTRATTTAWLHQIKPATWHFASGLAHMTYTSALPLLIPFVGTKETIAAYGAARGLVNPVMTARTALDTIEKPKASKAYLRHGLDALKAVLRQMRNKLLLLTAPAVLVLVLGGWWILPTVYGSGYEDQYGVLLICVATVVVMLLSQPLESQLVLTQRSHELVIAKVSSASIGLAAVYLLAGPYEASGVATAALLASLASLATMAASCHLRTAHPSGLTHEAPPDRSTSKESDKNTKAASA